MISLTLLENPLYLFADDYMLCHEIPPPSDRHAANFFNRSNTWNMSFNPEKSHTLTHSLRKDRSASPPIYFLNNCLKEVQSLKLFGLTQP